MKFDLIVGAGSIVTPTETFRADIGVRSGAIAAVGDLSGAAADARFDAKDKFVFPGFIDEHVHSRDPGQTHKEDFWHSTRAAAAGGITTLVEMPNSIPPVHDEASFEERVAVLSNKAFVDFALWAIVLGDENLEAIGPLARAGVAGFKLFWGYSLDRQTLALVYDPKPGQDVFPPPGDGEIFDAFQAIGRTGRPVAIHAENASVINRLAAREQRSGGNDYESLLRSRPPFTEAMAVEVGIRIASAAGAHLHILHVSSAEAIEAVELARSRGLRVTAETCPHYLVLSSEDYGRLGPRMKIFPPVREKRHQERLWRAVRDGVVDVIGSDHAPHTADEKEGNLWSVPAGASTVQATIPLMLNAVSEGKLSMNTLAAVLSENPAKLLGLYPKKGTISAGADADFVVVDLEKTMTISADDMLSKSRVNPYEGVQVKGVPVASFLRGKQIMESGKFVGGDLPVGRLIRPVMD